MIEKYHRFSTYLPSSYLGSLDTQASVHVRLFHFNISLANPLHAESIRRLDNRSILCAFISYTRAGRSRAVYCEG